jgi:endonuclease/exonuclease/phosphatase family metal-dependent hydrolase
MRVMTWNLQWRERDDWRERQPAIRFTLENVGPDVVALQEVWATAEATQAELLAEQFGMQAAFGAPSLPPPPGRRSGRTRPGWRSASPCSAAGLFLGVRRHRFPSRHRPEVVALAVVVDHPQGPLHLMTSCIDWELEFAAQRLAQTRTLAALVADPSRDGPLPALLTGDFNAPPTTPEILVLTQVMVDAWVEAGRAADPGHTLSTSNPLAPRAATHLIDQRIDYILARPGTPGRPMAVQRAFLAGEPLNGVYPSDHYAVVADFHL